MVLVMQKQIQSWVKCSWIYFALSEQILVNTSRLASAIDFPGYDFLISCFPASDRSISLERNSFEIFPFLDQSMSDELFFKQLSLDFILICLHKLAFNLMAASSNWDLVYQATRLSHPLTFDTLM